MVTYSPFTVSWYIFGLGNTAFTMVDTVASFLSRFTAMDVSATPIFSSWTVARMTALGRVALALSLLFLSTTELSDAGFELEPDDLVASTYLLLAIFLSLIAFRSWWWDFKLQRWALLADVLAFAIQPSLLHPEHDGYRLAALTLATFVLLSAALRWNWRIASILAVILNLGNTLLLYWHPIDFLPHVHSSQAHLRSSFFLILISFMIVWVGSRITGPHAPTFRATAGITRMDELLEEALEFALVCSGSGKGSICWRNSEDDDCKGIVTTLSNNNLSTTPPKCDDFHFDEATAGFLFDLDCKRCIKLGEDGDVTAVSGDQWEPPRAIVGSTVREGAIVPLTAGAGRGLLIIGDCKLPSIDLVRFLVGLGKELTAKFDRHRSLQSAREDELERLRNALARDLHDSVAQSIAGTRYLLNSLRYTKVSGSELDQELSRIDGVLAAEADHLRSTIMSLREGQYSSHEPDSGIGIERLSQVLSEQWRIVVTIGRKREAIGISRQLDYEIQQMIREGVSNAVRHGGASKVEIELVLEGGILELIIADNGRGFADLGISARPKMLMQRASELGGELLLATTHAGSIVTIKIPWSAST